MPDYNADRQTIPDYLPHLVGINPGRYSRIKGITFHATRGGSADPDHDDGPGTIGWARSPSNGGSFQDVLFGRTGQQTKCTRWEDDEEPRWAAGYGDLFPPAGWSMQDHYIQAEVSQSRADQPYSDASIDSAAQFVAEQAAIHDFPIVRVGYVDQIAPAPGGLTAHDDCANGRRLGKSDPGPLFPWARLIALAITYRGSPMTDDELLALFSGKEDAHLTRAVRLERARWRVVEAAEGRASSVFEKANSAESNLAAHVKASSVGPGPAGGATVDQLAGALEVGNRAAVAYLRAVGEVNTDAGRAAGA